LKGWIYQAESEICRQALDVLLQCPRDALPFGGLQRFRDRIQTHLQTASGLHGEKPRWEFTSAGDQAFENCISSIVGQGIW